MGAKASVYTNTSIMFFFLKYKITSSKKKKKPLFSPPICIQMFDSYLYLLSIWIKILQLCLYKIYIYIYKISSSKKNPLPHVKTTHSYFEIFMFFFFFNSLKHSKFFYYPNSM